MSSEEGPGPDVGSRLGYLFKHAGLRMAQLNQQALAPFGITSRELAVLLLLSGQEPASQHHAAQRLGVDRTTMVALLDTLEYKGMLSRRAQAQDRRRNVVELTDDGRDTLRRATRASDEAERTLLAPLDPQEAQHLRSLLRAIVIHPEASAGQGRATSL